MKSPRVNPIGLEAWGPSGFQMMIVKTQCQATTTRRLKARTKSMNASRSAPAGARWTGAASLLPSVAMARARSWSAIVLTVLALAGVNVASNRLVPDALYVPWAMLASAALLAYAVRVDGRSWAELGLARRQLPAGLRWGAVLAALVVLVLVVGLALPATRDLFRDERVEHWGLGRTLYAALVRVPLGTVLLEEVAFRAVLPAMLLARTRLAVAVGVSAALFGLWHVLPALGLAHVNPVADETLGQLPSWVTVAASVASTAAVGVWFWFLRHRSGSLLAPVALHWSTNGVAYLCAWWAWR